MDKYLFSGLKVLDAATVIAGPAAAMKIETIDWIMGGDDDYRQDDPNRRVAIGDILLDYAQELRERRDRQHNTLKAEQQVVHLLKKRRVTPPVTRQTHRRFGARDTERTPGQTPPASPECSGKSLPRRN